MRRATAFLATAALIGAASVPLAAGAPSTISYVSVVKSYQQSKTDYRSVGDLYQGERQIGQANYSCALSATQGKCTGRATLPKGTLALRYVYVFASPAGPVTITGGTGAYAGARGTGTYTPLNPLDSRTRITLHIR